MRLRSSPADPSSSIATASGDPEALATELRALGAENVTVFGRMVSGGLPITALPALPFSSVVARPSFSTPPGTGSPRRRIASNRTSRRRIGTDTTFFGGSDPDASGFPNFFGISAAAPHAAGIAALMIDLNPSLGPDAAYSVMKNTAVDMDDPATPAGFDCGIGFGLLQAEAALGASLQPPPPLLHRLRRIHTI